MNCSFKKYSHAETIKLAFRFCDLKVILISSLPSNFFLNKKCKVLLQFRWKVSENKIQRKIPGFKLWRQFKANDWLLVQSMVFSKSQHNLYLALHFRGSSFNKTLYQLFSYLFFESKEQVKEGFFTGVVHSTHPWTFPWLLRESQCLVIAKQAWAIFL